MSILAELVLATVTLFAGTLWWQLRKRRQFLRQAVRNETYLTQLISREALLNPPSRLEPYLQKNKIGYFVNVDVLNRADQRSQRLPRIFTLLLLAIVVVWSFRLGYSYLAVNGVLFCALSIVPIYDSAKYNAAEHILTLALILYRWRTDNPAECDQWVGQARSLEKLYRAMRTATATSAKSTGTDRDNPQPGRLSNLHEQNRQYLRGRGATVAAQCATYEHVMEALNQRFDFEAPVAIWGVVHQGLQIADFQRQLRIAANTAAPADTSPSTEVLHSFAKSLEEAITEWGGITSENAGQAIVFNATGAAWRYVHSDLLMVLVYPPLTEAWKTSVRSFTDRLGFKLVEWKVLNGDRTG